MAEQAVQNSISFQAADKLIAAHDGDVALLYLHWLRNGSLDQEKAAHDLCRTLQEIRAAEEKLRRMDVLGVGAAPAASASPAAPVAEPAPAEVLPEYTAAEISRRSTGNEALSVIYGEATQVLGHALNANELRVLFGIYDHLGLPPEVILELLHYCAELNRWKYKGERRLTPNFLEKEAYAWASREILTLDQAEEYIHAQRQRHSDIGRIQEALGLPALSATQRKDLDAWLEQGFGEEAIAIAADRTLTNTGALKWSYMRKILQSWQEKGLHSPSDIQEKDPARSRAAAAAAPAPGSSARPTPDRSELDYIRKKIRG